ncbi:hypothetical protein ACFQV4_25790 [Streptomyces thermocarboxydus]
MDTAGFHVAATVQQTYGAELHAMNADLAHAAGDSPPAVPLGILLAGCDPQLGAGDMSFTRNTMPCPPVPSRRSRQVRACLQDRKGPRRDRLALDRLHGLDQPGRTGT